MKYAGLTFSIIGRFSGITNPTMKDALRALQQIFIAVRINMVAQQYWKLFNQRQHAI